MDTFWSKDVLESLETCQNFLCLSDKAIRVIEKMQPGPVAQVCGPISTGGLGSIEKNLAVLNNAVKNLKARGLTVFEQHPLEKHIRRLCDAEMFEAYKKGDMRLLEEIYLPIFKSGYIHELHFVPLWNTSIGTAWEHEQAILLGLKIEYL